MADIELKNIYKIFGPRPQSALKRVQSGMAKNELLEKHQHTLGINDISLSIAKGEIFVIMGLSGSGKSTLVRHINRLIDPTSGSVYVDGKDIMRFTAKELRAFRRTNVSMVFQKFGLFPHKTIRENVAFGRVVQGYDKEDCKKRADSWMERVGLAAYGDAFPKQLSGGMQQRVGLARALATDADILLLDEPFSALDPLIRRNMQDILIDLQKDLRKTMVFITHDLKEAIKVGNRIAILKGGELIQVGTPDDILNRPADDYVAEFIEV